MFYNKPPFTLRCEFVSKILELSGKLNSTFSVRSRFSWEKEFNDSKPDGTRVLII